MGGAVLNGMILGFLVSGVVLAAVSLSTPLPPRDATPSDAVAPVDRAGDGAGDGAGTPQEGDGAPADAVPGPDPEADRTPDAAPDAAPEAEATDPDSEAALDPAPGPAPQSAVTGAEAEAVVLDAPARPAAPTEGAGLSRIDLPPSAAVPAPPAEAPALDAAPSQPDGAAPSPEVATAPETPAPPSLAMAPSPLFSSVADGSAGGVVPRRMLMPQGEDTLAGIDTETAPEPDEASSVPDETPTVPDEAAQPDAAPEPGPAPDMASGGVDRSAPDDELEAGPDTATDTATDPEPDPAAPRRLPQVAAPSTSPSLPAATSRLPQAGLPEPEAEVAPEPEEATEPDAPNALRDNAEDFEVAPGSPLMAVVLIDDPEGTIDVTSVSGFSFPVSFAIDPMRPDAAERAAEFRAAGHEVVILGAGAIPAGAGPGDVEVALAVARETMPQAVALMDDPGSRIQGDRPVLDATVGTLAETGHGLIAFPRGLNAAEETARRTGVPAATVFRLLDDEDQSAPVITRFLGRAAFAAAQEGAVVVVGHTRPDTVTALFSWALGSRTEGVELAPVSAVLGRLSE